MRAVRLLHRYMLGQILLASGMATAGFLFVIIVGNLFKGPLADVLGGRIPLGIFLEFTALLIPGLMPYVLPIGILIGVLLVLGRMSAQNEITAMKSAGMSLWRITAPIVAVGLMASLAAVFVNFEYATWANARGRELLAASPSTIIVEKQLITKFKGYRVYVGERDGMKLRDIWIWRLDKADHDADFIRAESGEITALDSAGESDVLPVVVRNAMIEQRRNNAAGQEFAEPVAATRLSEVRIEFPLGRALSVGEKKLRHHTYSELMAMREKGWKTTAQSPAKDRAADLMQVRLQIQTHLSGAFGIFSLTLLAIPLGIRVSRSETFVNFGVALALALTYYLLVVFVSWIKNPAMRPDLLVWIPNFIIQGVAIRLLLKASRS